MKQYLPKNPQKNTNGKLRITQLFWKRKSFYKKYWLKGHEWIDINPKPWISTPIYAVFDWNTYTQKSWAYGKRIDLYDDVWLVANYCHLSKILIKKWQKVKAWDLIWYSWKTTNYKGMAIHLHFMLKECNPKNWIIYNERNGFLWSIKIEYDKSKNRIFFNTKKVYIKSDVEKILDKWNDLLKSITEEQKRIIIKKDEEINKLTKTNKAFEKTIINSRVSVQWLAEILK